MPPIVASPIRLDRCMALLQSRLESNRLLANGRICADNGTVAMRVIATGAAGANKSTRAVSSFNQ